MPVISGDLSTGSQQQCRPRQAVKRANNLSLSAEVLSAAREVNINVSQVCDVYLREVVRQEQARRTRGLCRSAQRHDRSRRSAAGRLEDFLMALFDVFPNPGMHSKSTPYLLDVQSDLFDGLDSRMVVPLRSLAHFPKVRVATRLTPVFGRCRSRLFAGNPQDGLGSPAGSEKSGDRIGRSAGLHHGRAGILVSRVLSVLAFVPR